MRLRPTGAVPPGPAGASPDGSTERMEKQPKWFGCNWQATWVGGGKPEGLHPCNPTRRCHGPTGSPWHQCHCAWVGGWGGVAHLRGLLPPTAPRSLTSGGKRPGGAAGAQHWHSPVEY